MLLGVGCAQPDAHSAGEGRARPALHVFAEGGAWTWFNDERAIFVGPYLYVGYVDTAGYSSVSAYPVDSTLETGRQSFRLSSFQEIDDHNNPALLRLQDGRTLAAYAHHGSTSYWNWRFENEQPARVEWSPEQQTDALALPHGATYNNLFQLAEESGRTYNFFRGIGYDPTFMTSEDGGRSWSAPRHLIESGGSSTRPYVKYVSDGQRRIDLLYTPGHPQHKAENDVYHLYYQEGALHRSDGTRICRIEAKGCLPIQPEEGTRVYEASEAGRGWVWDVEYAEDGAPVGVYTTARGDTLGNPLHYRYARFDAVAGQWHEQEIAYAGSHLYDGEYHYAGGIALDPADVSVVYLSADVDPSSGDATETGRYQMYRGTTETDGARWTWEQLTRSEAVDHLRPFVPRHGGGRRAALWLRGRYAAYTDFDMEVVGLLDMDRSFNLE